MKKRGEKVKVAVKGKEKRFLLEGFFFFQFFFYCTVSRNVISGCFVFMHISFLKLCPLEFNLFQSQESLNATDYILANVTRASASASGMQVICLELRLCFC